MSLGIAYICVNIMLSSNVAEVQFIVILEPPNTYWETAMCCMSFLEPGISEHINYVYFMKLILSCREIIIINKSFIDMLEGEKYCAKTMQGKRNW